MEGDWQGFVGQVRDRYLAGELTIDEFEHDVGPAAFLDEGFLPTGHRIPDYLLDKFGLPIATDMTTCRCSKNSRCMSCMERDGLTKPKA